MKFRTEINIQKSDFQIDHHQHILSFGSCFSEHIGNRLKENKFRIVANPFGVLYNPSSVSKAMERLRSGNLFSESEILLHNHLHQSFMHHGSFSSTQKEECLDKINSSFRRAADHIRRTNLFLITFGTAHVFKLRTTGEVVANCHKFPADTFVRQRLSVSEITDEWTGLIRSILSENPEAKFIFTVSPIRHWKDGAHENQVSKSILHLAIDELTSTFNASCRYFPAYEILLDELRDYRFFDADMMHPSPIAIDYIWEKLGETYFSGYTAGFIRTWQKALRALRHKPFNADSKDHSAFLSQTLQQIEQLQKQYPHISFKAETDILSEKIRK